MGHGGIVKIGDFGMSRAVLPPPETLLGLTNPVAGYGSNAFGAGGAAGGGFGSGGGRGGRSTSTPGGSPTHGAPPLRTLTPGVVGTVAYAAPEIMDEQLQLPHAPVERMLKVRGVWLAWRLWAMCVLHSAYLRVW